MEIHKENYLSTSLEDWISAFYIRLKILHPRQINIEHIARSQDIFINRKPRPSFYIINGRYQGITIDSREDVLVQREMFFHELCHILRHSGIQGMMPDAFRELQEQDSRHFTTYAAIPFHMIKYIDLDDPYAIDSMSTIFKVTPELCKSRLEQIHNRYLKRSLIAESFQKYGS